MDPSSPQQSAPGSEPPRAAGPPRDFVPQLLDLMPRTKLQEKHGRSQQAVVSTATPGSCYLSLCSHTGSCVTVIKNTYVKIKVQHELVHVSQILQKEDWDVWVTHRITTSYSQALTTAKQKQSPGRCLIWGRTAALLLCEFCKTPCKLPETVLSTDTEERWAQTGRGERNASKMSRE